MYRNGSLDVDEIRIDEDSPFLPALDAVWREHLFAALSDLPAVPLRVREG